MKATVLRPRFKKPVPMRTYHYIQRRCPDIVTMMLQDLLRVEGFTEVDIAYGAGLPLETVRNLLFKRQIEIAPRDLLALLDFFSRLFYRPSVAR